MITITEFSNRYAKTSSEVHPLINAAQFREIALKWTHTVLTNKDKAALFSLCEYGAKESRQKDNIVAITGIVLDVDGGNTDEQLANALMKFEPYAHVWYTTYSHTPEAPKLRIVVPLAEPVTAEIFESESLPLRLAKWAGLKVDPCCASAAQCYYKPSKHAASRESRLYVCDSTTLFNIGLLPAKPAKPAKRGSQKTAEGQLEIFQKFDELVKDVFDGIEPIFFGDKFHCYMEGAWYPIDSGNTFSKMLIDHHARKISISETQELVSAMKIMCSLDQFPTPASNKITLKNGTLDVISRKLERHSPENFHSSSMNFDYEPKALCPQWLKFLNEIFLHDPDKPLKIQVLQEWIGYLLTPSTRYQVMLWLYGGGANGKSVITHTVRALLGTENVSSIPLSQLAARFISAELDGKLANIVDEIATDALMREDELKKIVSGDPILVERKNKDPYFFTPTARIFAATNSLPKSKDSTHALDRRLILLTCNRTFAPNEMDRDLVSKLQSELPGIFVWALNGLVRLRAQDGFTEAPSCVAALEDFKVARNSVALFRRDCLKMPDIEKTAEGNNKSFRIHSHELYKTYKMYCGANTYSAFSSESFGKKLKELGVEQIRTGGKRYYLAKVVNLHDAGIVSGSHSGWSKESIEDESGNLKNAA